MSQLAKTDLLDVFCSHHSVFSHSFFSVSLSSFLFVLGGYCFESPFLVSFFFDCPIFLIFSAKQCHQQNWTNVRMSPCQNKSKCFSPKNKCKKNTLSFFFDHWMMFEFLSVLFWVKSSLGTEISSQIHLVFETYHMNSQFRSNFNLFFLQPTFDLHNKQFL